MIIYVDADACPKVIKEILFRSAMRTKITTVLVANQYMQVPNSPFIKIKKVIKAFDAADHYIAEQVQPGDLVITADIPLAAEVVKKGGVGLDPRGQLYTDDNIEQRLTTRSVIAYVRETGVSAGGPDALNARDRQQFANQLDKMIMCYQQSNK